MKRALERHDNGSAYVIPIILTPLLWGPAPFGKLQALPKDGRAIALWSPRNSGWKNVVEGIVKVAEALGAGRKLDRAENASVGRRCGGSHAGSGGTGAGRAARRRPPELSDLRMQQTHRPVPWRFVCVYLTCQNADPA